MTDIITIDDLPSEVVAAFDPQVLPVLIDGLNADASRAAPCLVPPPGASAWSPMTAYAVGDQVELSDGEYLEATEAGTSGAAEPDAPQWGKSVEDGTVTWKLIAPTLDQTASARALLVSAVMRWAKVGVGGTQQETAGPFSRTIQTTGGGGFHLWPSEIERLQEICAGPDDGSAWGYDTVPCGSPHLPWCSLSMGALYCSCGVDIAGKPIYEL